MGHFFKEGHPDHHWRPRVSHFKEQQHISQLLMLLIFAFSCRLIVRMIVFVLKAAVNAGFTTRGRRLATLTGIYTSVLKLFCRYVITTNLSKTLHCNLACLPGNAVHSHCDWLLWFVVIHSSGEWHNTSHHVSVGNNNHILKEKDKLTFRTKVNFKLVAVVVGIVQANILLLVHDEWSVNQYSVTQNTQ